MNKKLSIINIFAVFVFLLLIVFVVGCNKSELVEDSSAEIMQNSVVSTEPDALLADYDGWWYIDKASHDGVSLIENFYMDAQAMEYTVYTNEGFSATTLNAKKGDDGELILDLQLFGEVSMTLLDSNTLTCEDGMIFRRGEPMPKPDYSQFTGIWYENGDENGSYYKLSNDGSYEYYAIRISTSAETEEASETGTYTFSTMTRYIDDSESFKSLCLTMDDGSGFTDDLYMLESGVGLLDSGFDNNFYIRSNALGTALGNDTISFCTLVLTNLWNGDHGNYFSFTEDGMFKLSTADKDDKINAYDGGTWWLNGEDLFLIWNNGEKETAEYRIGDGFFVPSLKEIFTDIW